MLVVLCLLLTGCSSALLDPKGQIGVEQRSLILTSFGLMLIVVIPVIRSEEHTSELQSL